MSEEEVALVVVSSVDRSGGKTLTSRSSRRPRPRTRSPTRTASSTLDEDPLLDKAIEIVVTQTASVSLLQRRLRVGYTRAGRLIDMLERRGIISGYYEGLGPRRVLVSRG